MSEKDQDNPGISASLKETYQPDVLKTYTPKVVRLQTNDSYTPNLIPAGNYQPVIPMGVSAEQHTPPTGASGVPAARSSVPVATKKGSSE